MFSFCFFLSSCFPIICTAKGKDQEGQLEREGKKLDNNKKKAQPITRRFSSFQLFFYHFHYLFFLQNKRVVCRECIRFQDVVACCDGVGDGQRSYRGRAQFHQQSGTDKETMSTRKSRKRNKNFRFFKLTLSATDDD